MSIYNHVCLHTHGYELPTNVLSSDDIEQRLASVYERLKLPAGRLEMMSGITERRLWDPGTRPSEAAARAGKKTIEQADIDPQEIQCLFFTSVSRDMMEPATASFVHHFLGLPADCLIFDISNACLGFLDGMVMLANMIELGQVDNGLVVSGETAEELINSTILSLREDKSINRKAIKRAFASLTIGSGAVALYMCRCEAESRDKPRLRHCAWRANTDHSDLCQGGQSGKSTTLMSTDSGELLVQGVNTAHQTWLAFTDASGWRAEDIDQFFCHQVGTAHAKLLFDRLNLDITRNFETLPFLGNVGSVSAPITMAMAIEQGVFAPGQKGAMLGIGSGINCLMLGIDW
jgi:3-oxoacyl-[acyl-carrier-protein] synthase-3